jgi:NADH dehydrogenase
VEVAQADIRDRAATTRACADADVVVSAVQGVAGPGRVSPQSVDREGNKHLVAAAQAAGADLVLMSVIGAAADHPMLLFRMKAAAESSVQSSGLGWTIVRSSAFIELHAEVLRETTARMRRPLVMGRGDNPVNFVAVDDVAAVVVAAILDPSLRGEVVEVAGPDNLTFDQLASLVVPGAPPRHVPRGLLRAAALLPGKAGRLAGLGLAMDTVPLAVAADEVRRPDRLAVTRASSLDLTRP